MVNIGKWYAASIFTIVAFLFCSVRSQKCDCNPAFSKTGTCQKENGTCNCIRGYAKKGCEECDQGYFRQDDGYCDKCPEGEYADKTNSRKCKKCNCVARPGKTAKCDNVNGECLCGGLYKGSKCDQCIPGYGKNQVGNCEKCPDGKYKSSNTVGDECTKCLCNTAGSVDQICDKKNGNCKCKEGYTGRGCRGCLPSYSLERKGEDETICTKCAIKYWIGMTHFDPLRRKPVFCKPCISCPLLGTVHGEKSVCNQSTGQCPCLPGHTSDSCLKCKKGYQDYGGKCKECPDGQWKDKEGLIGKKCSDCSCSEDNSQDEKCDKVTGQCNCKPKYAGLRCQECNRGYRPTLNNDNTTICEICPDGKWSNGGISDCVDCKCNPKGSKDQMCDKKSGECTCRRWYEGKRCDSCQAGYGKNEAGFCESCLPGKYSTAGKCETCEKFWFTLNGRDCQKSLCNEKGTSDCDKRTGECLCKDGYGGAKCDKCMPGYFQEDGNRCSPCNCVATGSKGQSCSTENQQCDCKKGYKGTRCTECKTNFLKTEQGQCLENLALKKQARQSSTYSTAKQGKKMYAATLAVDGNRNGLLQRGSCSHTDEAMNGKHNCWYVDLEKEQVIDEIRIWNRKGHLAKRLSNVFVYLSSDEPVTTMLPKGDARECGSTGVLTEPFDVYVKIHCSRKQGQYLSVVKNGHYLTLCEVEVFEASTSCNCLNEGVMDANAPCDRITNMCKCKSNVEGSRCDKCKAGFYKLSEGNQHGCRPCDCFLFGTNLPICDTNGRCICKTGMIGLRCSIIKSGYFINNNVYEAEHSFVGEKGNSVVEHGVKVKKLMTFKVEPQKGAYYIAFSLIQSTHQSVEVRMRVYMDKQWDLDTECDSSGTKVPSSNIYKTATGTINERQKAVIFSSLAICFPSSKNFKISIYFGGQLESSMILDRIFLIPTSVYDNIPINLKNTVIDCLSGPCDQNNEMIYSVASNEPQKCQCSKQGSKKSICNQIGGQCPCKDLLTGRTCNRCQDDYYHEQKLSECEACQCNKVGVLNNMPCDQTGQCHCKRNVEGRLCDRCKAGFYELSLSNGQYGCAACSCFSYGTLPSICDKTKGECSNCKDGITGSRCSAIKPGYFVPKIQKATEKSKQDTIEANLVTVQFSVAAKRGEYYVALAMKKAARNDVDVKMLIQIKNDANEESQPNAICKESFQSSSKAKASVQSSHRVVIFHKLKACVPSSQVVVISFEFSKESEMKDNLDWVLLIPASVIDKRSLALNDALWDCLNNGNCNTEELHIIMAGGKTRKCQCSENGAEHNFCEQYGGQCLCKKEYRSRRCDRCQPTFYMADSGHCRKCQCSQRGAWSSICDENTGQCDCKSGFIERRCNECKNRVKCITSVCKGHQELNEYKGFVISGVEESTSNYANNVNCSWTIKRKTDHALNLHFESFSIQKCDDCKCDVLEVIYYEGIGENREKKEMKLCGTKEELQKKDIFATYRLSIDSITVRFSTDSTTVENGFRLQYMQLDLAEAVEGKLNKATPQKVSEILLAQRKKQQGKVEQHFKMKDDVKKNKNGDRKKL